MMFQALLSRKYDQSAGREKFLHPFPNLRIVMSLQLILYCREYDQLVS